jgi:hypothetical protein
MKTIRFQINADYYEQLKNDCLKSDITIKKKINVLVTENRQCTNYKKYFPLDYREELKFVTLKLNDELHKSIMIKCNEYDLTVGNYIPYLIYKYLFILNGSKPFTKPTV